VFLYALDLLELNSEDYRQHPAGRFIKPPLTDKEIVAKGKELKRLRDRLGLSRWCRRYAGEMDQARILVEVLRRQN
jgi:hypothetical protein